jgi:hypothetical protein
MRAGLLQWEVREETKNSYVVKAQRLQLASPGDRMIQSHDQSVAEEILGDPVESGRYGRRRGGNNGGRCLGAAAEDYTYHAKCGGPQALEIHNT